MKRAQLRSVAASVAVVVATTTIMMMHSGCNKANAFSTNKVATKKSTYTRTHSLQAFEIDSQSLSNTKVNSLRPVLPIAQRTRFQGALALIAIITASNNGLQFQAVPIGESLLALVASIVLVSGATDAVERITASSTVAIPAYNENGCRYDQSFFFGRYCKMLLACDPRLLLYTEDEVRQYHKLAYVDYADVRSNAMKEGATYSLAETDRLLWEAKRIADSALHPETQEWIPRPCRMSGYLPYNGPICIAMVSVQSTIPLLFWSWVNQSQNAAVNYFNGPKSTSSDDDATTEIDGTLFKSYSLAVASALIVAFGLATYVQTNFSGEETNELLRFIAFPSAVIASSLNCYIIRSPEIETGAPLLNEQLENVLPGETSSAAAKRGVFSTTASRAVLQMPTYFIPPLLLDTVTPLKQFLVEDSLMVVPVTTFLLLVSFGIGLPAAVGIFPQVSSIKAEDVEDKFRDLGYEEFYYNKGL
eukprot:scaffold17737_cov108-Skeletonema_marinoi.AAC.3